MAGHFQNKVKKIHWSWWVLAAIVIIGIFLRTWHFHDWLRFNADQGRDAQVVSGAVEGKTGWPVFGPKAGGTQFRLGPAFYYFEIASTEIFGNYPDKMAYPDLFASVLSIPLLFLFLRKYFDRKASLFLAAVFSVSAYAVFYSRFAWNPNSTPFWTILFLYAVSEIFSENSRRKFVWSAAAGIALGIDVQLHTTLLVILPIFTLAVFSYFFFKKREVFGYFFVLLALALLVNIPQIVSECKTKGKNTKEFFHSLETKKKPEGGLVANSLQSASCFVQGNISIISGYEISDKCAFKSGKDTKDTVVFVLGSLFVLGGLAIGSYYFLREKDADRKIFLGIIFFFAAASFLIFSKMAFELSPRFYLPLIFLPFFLAGFWMKFISEKMKIRPIYILSAASLSLVVLNLFFIQKSFASFADHEKGGVRVTILWEAEKFSDFIIRNSGGAEKVFVCGDNEFMHKAFTSMEYLAGRSNIKLSLVKHKSPPPDEYFQIATGKRKEEILSSESLQVLGQETFGKFTILHIKKK